MDGRGVAKWCQQHKSQPENCLALLLPGISWTDSQIRDACRRLPIEGRGFLLDNIPDTAGQQMFALIEWRDPLTRDDLPTSITLPEGVQVNVIVPQLEATPVIAEAVESSTETVNVTQAEVTPSQTSIGLEVLNALGSLVEKCLKSNTQHTGFGYRKLRFFSGIQPTPSGEDDFEAWMDQASRALAEWDVPEAHKKQRITESLKGPAADAIRNLTMCKKECTAQDYLEVLHDVFGRTERVSDLLYQFEHTYQAPGEKLSKYIARLDKILHQIILKKGLEPQVADRTRVSQVLQGAQPMDPIMWKLRMKDNSDNITYHQLIKLIREEEAMLEEKQKGVRQELAVGVGVVTAMDINAEINSMKTQMSQMMEMITILAGKGAECPKENVPMAPPAEARRADLNKELREGVICYNCGGIGHYRRNCPSKEKRSLQEPTECPSAKSSNKLNDQRRNSKRISPTPRDKRTVVTSDSFKWVKDQRKADQRGLQNPRNLSPQKISGIRRQATVQHGSTDCRTTDVYKPKALPNGLVGPSPEVSVKIEGVYGRAVLDTGAQITILYRDFYHKYLKHLPLTKLEDLEIWGLSDTKFPYDGYVSISLEFPATVVGSAEAFETLAVVCPKPREDTGAAILVGTNTEFVRRMLRPQLSQNNPNLHPALKPVFQELQQGKSDERAKAGHVWLLNKREQVIPPGRLTCLRATVKLCGKQSSSHFMMEMDPEVELPPGLELVPEVWPASKMKHSDEILPVGLKNKGDLPIVLSPKVRLGSVYAATPLPTLSHKKTENLDLESVEIGGGLLSAEWMARAQGLIKKRKNCFSSSELDVGCAKSAHHRIRLREDRPFRERSRRVAPGDLGDLRKHLEELKAAGIIRESRSPYASPIVVVRKKNGSIRMCVDYRTLNQRTVPDQYTTPRIEDALNCLVGSKWFSVLDLRSGYYQIPMHREDSEKTAFICPLGFFQFDRMPQGLSGSPATFQRLMENTVGDMHLLEVLVYLDDIIVFGKTLEEHEERLSKVLDRLEKEGLKLSLDKCKFFQPSVTYVGHVVSAEGIATDPGKVSAVTTWPRPRTITEVRSFLGFCGYYRRFVEGFSKIARPLNQLLQNEVENEEIDEDKLLQKPKGPRGSKESIEDRWTPACEQAFEHLKHCLTHAPVLAYADSDKPYVLHVDASRDGLGGVLYQENDKKLKPIAFVSRSLSPTEKNYPAHKLEFLALKWTVVDKLHDYLYGAEFEVQTDNNPLTYIQTTAKLDATGHRWMAALSNYNFSLRYRPGKQNGDADGLSRRPHEKPHPDDEWVEIPAPGVRTMCQVVNCYPQKGCWAKTMCLSEESVPQVYCNIVTLQASPLPSLGNKELMKDQREDPLCTLAAMALREKQIDILRTNAHPLSKLLAKEWDRLQLRNGLVYRRAPSISNNEKWQLLLPQKHRDVVLQSLHDEHGHLGYDKTLGLVRDRFYWPCMKQDVDDYCRSCLRCLQRKTLPTRFAPLGKLESSGPMELVCIDFLCIEPDEGGISNVLVVTDHYTRYAQAFPTRDQKAITVAKILVEKFFVHYGLPKRIHSDQGRDFESKLIHELLTTLGVQKSRTTPYHPQGDPQPERFNRTLLNMLGTLSVEKKAHWSRHVATAVHAYNSTKNDATGFSPYFLMFGREARLPVDLVFGVTADDTPVQSHTSYVERLKRDLKNAYESAEAAMEQRHQQNKRHYDRKIKIHDLQPGDKVLLRNLGLHGKNKLADRWGSEIYIICSQLPNIPVYQIRPQGKEGPIKTWHRNNIMMVSESMRKIDPKPSAAQRKPNSRRSRRLRRRGNVNPVMEPSSTFFDESDETEDEWGFDCMFHDGNIEQSDERPLNVNAPEFVPCHVDHQVDIPTEGETSVPEIEMAPLEVPVALESKDCFCELSNAESMPPDNADERQVSEHDSNFSQEPEDELSESVSPVMLSSPVADLEPRPQRTVRPPQRLTYDVLGHSTQEAVATAHRTVNAKFLSSKDTTPCPTGDISTQTKCSASCNWWEVPFECNVFAQYALVVSTCVDPSI